MIELINLPLDDDIIKEYGGIDNIEKIVKEYKIDSIEWIYSGRECNYKVPEHLSKGYHLTFFSDWYDFYKGNKKRLIEKFDDEETIKIMYGSTNPQIIMQKYKDDIKRAKKLKSEYIVFHLSDVSLEEGFSYRFEHTDKEIIDASVEIINEITKDLVDEYFLIENLWWAGFRFDNYETTKYIMEKIKYKNKGIVLDTGHLLNTNVEIKNEKEASLYILEKLEEHRDIKEYIKAIHLNKSLSGEYVKKTIPKDIKLKGKFFDRFQESYKHILNIDTHSPFEEKYIKEVIKEIKPLYIVHELSGKKDTKLQKLKIQKEAMI